MNTYLLKPINPDDPCWNQSDSNQPLTVEAESEADARNIASGKFGNFTDSNPFADNPECPWCNPLKASCALIHSE